MVRPHPWALGDRRYARIKENADEEYSYAFSSLVVEHVLSDRKGFATRLPSPLNIVSVVWRAMFRWWFVSLMECCFPTSSYVHAARAPQTSFFELRPDETVYTEEVLAEITLAATKRYLKDEHAQQGDPTSLDTIRAELAAMRSELERVRQNTRRDLQEATKGVPVALRDTAPMQFPRGEEGSDTTLHPAAETAPAKVLRDSQIAEV